MADGKYYVIKRDHLASVRDMQGVITGAQLIDLLEENDLPDAHVFREQDIFAGPVLHTYVGAIQTAIEVMDQQGVVVPGYFYELRERFAAAAEAADANPVKKLPD